jgi:hypothetical protein
MSMIIKCVCCDQPVANQYAPTALCESCKEPCEVCNGPVQNCQHPLEVAGKLMGSGGDTAHWTGDLRSRLLDELADASSAIHFFAQANLTAEE